MEATHGGHDCAAECLTMLLRSCHPWAFAQGMGPHCSALIHF